MTPRKSIELRAPTCGSVRGWRATGLITLLGAAASCASVPGDAQGTSGRDWAACNAGYSSPADASIEFDSNLDSRAGGATKSNAGPSIDESTLEPRSDPTLQLSYQQASYPQGYPPPPPYVQGYPPPPPPGYPQTVYVQGYPPPGYVVLMRPDYGPLAAKPGFYLSASVTGTGMGGDLNGENVLIGPAIVWLPSVDAGVGFNVAAGFRAPADAFEMSYDYSGHSGSFQGVPLDSTFNAINFDWKHYFRIEEKLQPYTLLGMNFPWLDIHDGAHKGATVGDATLYGWGANIGGGVAYYITPQLSVSLQAVCLLIDYFEVSALGRSGTLDSGVFSPGWKLNLGTAFTF